MKKNRHFSWTRNGRVTASISLLALLLPGSGCGARSGEPATSPRLTNHTTRAVASPDPQRVRAAAVAGLFYPSDGQALSKAVDGLLDRAPGHYIPRLKGLVCPHAGYAYSGRTAAAAYKLLAGRDIQTVIIMGPSHYAIFQGASIPNANAFRTPLGLVPVSEKSKALSSVSPFVLEPRCPVERPPFWQQSPKPAPEPGQDTPETWEHSVEVQLPFLQRSLKDFKILPILFGDTSPDEAARALTAVIDDKTIIVASSDLSHYHPYDVAKELDGRCVKAICDLDIEQVKTQEACGKLPILTLMRLAWLKGWKARLLDCRNSGDVTGEKDRVVGYTAVAFYDPANQNYSAEERRFLLELARRTLKSVATNGDLPDVQSGSVAAKLAEKKACFVTLTADGALRGCIGHILPQESLYKAVMDNACSAALRDPRFLPVRPDEVDKIKIEISVLTEPKPLQFSSPEDLLSKLRPYEDGVVLRVGPGMATFLPQVWAQLPDKVQFLNHLSQKAGCEPSAWRGKDTSVSIYRVESFEED